MTIREMMESLRFDTPYGCSHIQIVGMALKNLDEDTLNGYIGDCLEFLYKTGYTKEAQIIGVMHSCLTSRDDFDYRIIDKIGNIPELFSLFTYNEWKIFVGTLSIKLQQEWKNHEGQTE